MVYRIDRVDPEPKEATRGLGLWETKGTRIGNIGYSSWMTMR
jgi:hypothetical protein